MVSFNETTRWSRLARLGKSPLARLTIVTPFLGFVIFLNTGLDDYLKLGPTGLSEGWLSYLADRRVELLYIGLTILGAATGLFSLFAPDTIKNSHQYSDFIQFKEDTKTSNAVVGSLEKTLQLTDERIKNLGSESFGDISASRNFPQSVIDSISRLVISVFEEGEEKLPRQAAEFEPDEVFHEGYYTAQGLPNLDPILECVVNCRRIEYGVWKGFFNTAPNFSIDVFRLEYLIKDYSRPNLRGFVFSAFLFGSFVSLIPTLTSIWMVLLFSF